MPRYWTSKLKRLGKLGKIFCVLLVVYLALIILKPASLWVPLTQVVLLIIAAWIVIRLTRVGMRKAIWRLRNRLLVTYLFIAVVPVALILVFVCMGGYALISQLAIYLAMSDLERRANMLRDVAETLAASESRLRPELMHKMTSLHRKRFPNLAVIAKDDSSVQTWPPEQTAAPPPAGWKDANGVVVRNGRFLLWSHARSGNTSVTVFMPLSRAYLSDMVPGLGDVSLLDIGDESAKITVSDSDGKVTRVKSSREPPSRPLPSAYNRFDVDVGWLSTVSVWEWEHPGKKLVTLLFVHTRLSAVLNTILSAKVDQVGDLLPIFLLALAIAFLIVEVVALIIGVSLTRTITRAVHNLYHGTQRVMEGDFSHRIQVNGRDQLGSLSSSFNSMTENLERLLAVAKEKERMQAELEIARQVQEQLLPKVVPSLKTLRLTAVCEPARMVSGDYYDYLCLPDGRLAMAIGDVAGKGISAALLMATIQAAMRMELRTSRAMAAPSGLTEMIQLPTSRLVSDLNQQLHATTAPEKFATFFFSLYNENTGELRYTNAGHLPPLLVRKGSAFPLEVSGTVVGAFPSVEYEENRLQMESGDLLLCYTDGITEPENEYGEEFGEARLIDLITKNAERDDARIVSMVLEAVHQWTSAPEQPDDMTLLLARKI